MTEILFIDPTDSPGAIPNQIDQYRENGTERQEGEWGGGVGGRFRNSAGRDDPG